MVMNTCKQVHKYTNTLGLPVYLYIYLLLYLFHD
jgi:hypothetical protein